MQTLSETVTVHAAPDDVFAYVDDHAHLSSHMSKSSWMMGGGHMDVEVDEGGGKRIGSHIRLAGRVFGKYLSLDEVVTEYDPPRLKSWETVGSPRLIIVGWYRMCIRIEPSGQSSQITVAIDYDLPKTNAWLGKLFDRKYAQWCVNQMIRGVADHFEGSRS